MSCTSLELKRHLEARGNSFYFALFLFIHIVIWSLGPYFVRPTLTHDTLEGITWGMQWQLGYNKHPFLTAWLCAGITQLFGSIDWPMYLLAQLAVTTTFIAVWQLAKQILAARQALVATLILEAVLFYNINSFNFTPDTLQSPLWALLSLFFYHALNTQKNHYWLLTGLFAALCVCTKYQIIVLFIPMLCLCLWNPVARNSFKKTGIYYALAIFILCITPHWIWLYQHDFITLNYAKNISAEYTDHKTIFSHVFYPLLALANELFAIMGVFILLWPFYTGKDSKKKMDTKLTRFQWQFLITIGFGPLICSLIMCMLSGDYFPPRWSTPYFFATGIIIMGYLQPSISKKQMKDFTLTFILFSFTLFFIRIAHLSLFSRAESDASLPNQEMAAALSKLWHSYSPTPLSYIAGSNYLVSLVTPYMDEQPKPYLSWDARTNPWVKEEDLRKKGALFIWDVGNNYIWDANSKAYALIPQEVLNRFPNLTVLPNYTFYRTSNHQKIIIGVGILPPEP